MGFKRLYGGEGGVRGHVSLRGPQERLREPSGELRRGFFIGVKKYQGNFREFQGFQGAFQRVCGGIMGPQGILTILRVVSKGLKSISGNLRSVRSLHGVSGRFKGPRRFSKTIRGLHESFQGVLDVLRGFKEVLEPYQGLRRVSGNFRESQESRGVSGGF